MKLELDFTNKVIMVVGSGSVEEFNATIKKLKLQDWTIGINSVRYYPVYPNFPPYEITCTSNTTGCGYSDKCNVE